MPDHNELVRHVSENPLNRYHKIESLSIKPEQDFKLLHRKLKNNSKGRNIFEDAFNKGYYKRFFIELEKLGRGAAGSVYLCQHVLDDVMLGFYAIKKIPIGDNHEWLERALFEVSLLEKLSHENIIGYRHSWIELHTPSDFGPEIPCLFILMEFADRGSLEGIVQNRIKLSKTELLTIAKQILTGLSYIHNKGLVHNDIKTENILLTLDNNKKFPRVLIADFDIAGDFRNLGDNTGTIDFCSPEELKQNLNRTVKDAQKSDVWAVGMVIYYLYYQRLPYENIEDPDKLKTEISEIESLDFDDDKDLPNEIRSFLIKTLSINPKNRFSSQEALDLTIFLLSSSSERKLIRLLDIKKTIRNKTNILIITIALKFVLAASTMKVSPIFLINSILFDVFIVRYLEQRSSFLLSFFFMVYLLEIGYNRAYR
eukprot:GHVP01052708.1.p1 GENE.GHVP01052708.1~~GHVP01052708.1.p1  ORF type:complete len:426 (-),score=54.06 GHVP01052708.1:742-2019(-)